MTFRLRIPGRDDAQAVVASPANPQIDSQSVSGLAELADGECTGMKTREGIVSLPPSLSKYTQTIITLPPDVAATVEEERRIQRRARIVWMGYVEVADQLAETLKARDRRLDDRRLCVECAHAGPRWHCRKKQGFLTDVLQRCKYFEEGS
ncbi:MAG: hypothetical protein ACXWC3_24690 [Burkholderiales bacterium]